MDRDRIFFGTVANDHGKPPAWYGFDAAWYRRRYARQMAEATETLDDEHLAGHWEATEGADGTSPNRYFDEEWYLQHYPDVCRGVRERGIFRSGFQHYVDVGCQSCAGHWLFSAEYYLKENPDYGLRSIREAGYVNVYDHFIRVGDRSFRAPHPFFDAELFIRGCLNQDIPFDASRGALDQYLSLEHPEAGTLRTSWYFDPVWYLSQYPEAAELVESGAFISPLHHYMSCEEPDQYNPNPHFDETYYLSRYPDVHDAVEQGIFRNGYAHFIRTGIREGRNPSPRLDMAAFVSTLDLPHDLNQAHVGNPFLLWVKRQEGEAPSAIAGMSVTMANDLALRKVEASLPSLFRHPLQFLQARQPPLSVILLSQGNYLLDIASLTSIHEQDLPGIQVIVASQGTALARQRLGQAVQGLEYAVTDRLLSCDQRLQQLLPLVRGTRILLVEAGMQLLPMALSSAMACMEEDRAGGSGKILTTTNQVLEAGSAVWRDGRVTLCGQGENAQAQPVSFQRIMEAVQGGLLFCQRDSLLRALDYLEDCSGDALFICLSIALRAVGGQLGYWPTVQARVLHETPESYARQRAGRERLRQLFPGFLPTHAITVEDARTGNSHRPVVMMVFPHLPRQVEGGPARRIMQQIEMFRHFGWTVLVIGLEHGEEDRLVIPHDYPADVECWRDVKDFPAFLKSRLADMKLLWLGGTDVLARLGPVLASGGFTFRDKAIVLDVVSQNGAGLKAMETHLRRLVGAVDEPETLREETLRELEYAWLCQGIIAGDAPEAALLNRLGFGNVVHLPYAVSALDALPGQKGGFDGRAGVLFPFSIYAAGDAGHDGFDWFCLSVMPHLRRHFGEKLPVWIGGYHDPVIDLGFYERLAPLDGLVEMGSLHALFRQCLVLIGPSRVLATQATEILDAAGQGLPAVLSTPQMERLGWQDEQEALDGGFNDPEHFARQLIRLHEDQGLWECLRAGAYADVRKHHNEKNLRSVFSRFLRTLFAGAFHAERPARVAEKPGRAFAPAPLHVTLQQGLEPAPALAGADEQEEKEDDFIPLPTHLGVTLPREEGEWKGESNHG